MANNWNKEGIAGLWEEILLGDERAFESLYKSTYGFLFGFGLSVHKNRSVVKDALQEFYLTLWRDRESWPKIENHQSYFCQILKRLLLKSISRKQKTQNIYSSERSSPSYESILISRQLDEEKAQKLSKAFESLTSSQRKVIQLRFFEFLSYDEIAEKTNTKKRTVYNQIHASLKILKDIV